MDVIVWIPFLIVMFLLLGFAVYMFVTAIISMVRQFRVNAGSATAARGKRFSQVVPYTGDYGHIGALINEFLCSRGFMIQNYGGETVYRYGVGMWMAPRFIKVSQVPDGLLIEAFITAYNFLRLTEMGTSGAFAFAAKAPLRANVNELIAMINYDEQTRAQYQYQQYQYQQYQDPNQQA